MVPGSLVVPNGAQGYVGSTRVINDLPDRPLGSVVAVSDPAAFDAWLAAMRERGYDDAAIFGALARSPALFPEPLDGGVARAALVRRPTTGNRAEPTPLALIAKRRTLEASREDPPAAGPAVVAERIRAVHRANVAKDALGLEDASPAPRPRSAHGSSSYTVRGSSSQGI
jgi:hypothetical protein